MGEYLNLMRLRPFSSIVINLDFFLFPVRSVVSVIPKRAATLKKATGGRPPKLQTLEVSINDAMNLSVEGASEAHGASSGAVAGGSVADLEMRGVAPEALETAAARYVGVGVGAGSARARAWCGARDLDSI